MVREFLTKTLTTVALALCVLGCAHIKKETKTKINENRANEVWANEVLAYNEQVCTPYATIGKTDGNFAELKAGGFVKDSENPLNSYEKPHGTLDLIMAEPIYNNPSNDFIIRASGDEYVVSVKDNQGNWIGLAYGCGETEFGLPLYIDSTTIVRIEATGYESVFIDSVKAIEYLSRQ